MVLFATNGLTLFEKVPRKVEFVEEIPKTLIGKPLRRALVAYEQRRQDARVAAQTAQEDQAAQEDPDGETEIRQKEHAR